MSLHSIKIIDKAASAENSKGEYEFTIDDHPISICAYSVERSSADAICKVTFTIYASEVIVEHKLLEGK